VHRHRLSIRPVAFRGIYFGEQLVLFGSAAMFGTRCSALVGFLVLNLLVTGCGATHFIHVPEYSVRPAPPPGNLIAGAGSVDITPAPGYPMAGHSFAGRFSRGRWMRLRARAFYFRDRGGSSVALVSCDLFAISAGLQEMVAAKLHPRPGKLHPRPPGEPVWDISPTNLVLVATHTHQGPGGFMSNEFYNGFASPYPGHDPVLFNTLAERIAEAVRAAVKDAEGHPGGATLAVRRGTMELTRNRAIEAFALNPSDVKDAVLRAGPPAPLPGGCTSAPDWYAPRCLRYRAVDSTLTTIDIERPGQGAVATLVFFSAHPTVLAHDASFYSPDFTGWAMAELERRSGNTAFVAGWFNGTDGDVSARWEKRDAAEVRELGRKLVGAIDTLRSRPAAFVEDDSAVVIARRRTVPRRGFCKTKPTPGVATLGGAEDGRFVTFDMGWRERSRRGPGLKPPESPDPAQCGKEPSLGLKGTFVDLTDVLGPPRQFPREVPVSLVEIGRVIIAGVPVEMTTVMGLRVKQAIDPDGRRLPIVVGPANEYFEYVASPDEYSFQDYVGASTLFGCRMGQCMIDLIAEASATPPDPGPRAVHRRVFNPGQDPAFGVKFGPAYWGASPEYTDQELDSPFVGYTKLDHDLWPRVEWASDDPEDEVSIIGLDGAGKWTLEQADGPNRALAPEESSALFTTLLDGAAKPARWKAVWLPDPAADPTRVHRIRVKLRNEALVCSPAFSLAEIQTGRVPLPMPAEACPASP
jgi:neutral ceramidase